MVKKVLGLLVVGALVVSVAMPVMAQGNGGEKKTVNGPSTTSFGPWQLVLAAGAVAEVTFDADANRLIVKTLAGDAQLITGAYNLVIVERQEGTVEITLPSGRKITVKDVEIAGRALDNDPGRILVLVAGIGGGTVATGTPAFALSGVVTQPTPLASPTTPRGETSLISSPTLPNLGFGRTVTP